METFRFSLVAAIVFASLACARASGTVEQAPIAQPTIEHISPKRDSVGASPARFEWTAVKDAESYSFELHNEILLVASSQDIAGTVLEWPADQRLAPGTYFWMVSAIRDGRSIAKSGRSAFVVSE